MSNKVRAIVNGKEMVGWYAVLKNNTHTFVTHEDPVRFHSDAIWVKVWQIDPATAAVDTGRKDKHGKPIFGSKGLFEGGDMVKADGLKYTVRVNWNDKRLHWGLPMATALGSYESDELEIIPKEE